MVPIEQMEYTFVYSWFQHWDSGTGFGSWYSGVNEVVKGPKTPVPKPQQFPGFLDRGTPLHREYLVCSYLRSGKISN